MDRAEDLRGNGSPIKKRTERMNDAMRIYDLSQEVFTCAVFEGDPKPKRREVRSICAGDLYNLTEFSMCAHNGTHVDAPSHFYANGETVDRLELERCVGLAAVVCAEGEITAAEAERLLERARGLHPDAAKRLLLKGRAVVTVEAAQVFLRAGVLLIGVESQTVGPEDAPMAVHLALLGERVVLLEGLRLSEPSEGAYFLFAAPLPLGGCDGAPCRAILVDGVAPKDV